MNQFKNILVYVDTHSDVPQAALDRAAELAKANGASLTVADVVPEMPWHASAVSAFQDRIHDVVEEQKRLRLDALVAPLRQANLEVESPLLRGKPFLALTREVLKNNHDLVIKTAMGQEYYERAYGETAMHLFRKCPCPVWIERPGNGRRTGKNGSRPKIGHVAVSVDPAPNDEGRNNLMIKLLDVGRGLADTEDGRLSVVHSWAAFGQHLAHSHLGPQAAEAYRTDVRAHVEPYIQDFVKENINGFRKNQLHLLEGDPRRCIPEFVKDKNVDMLVLGTVARTGVMGLLIGNTAESLMNQVRCSVLVVKPDGFVSPVKLPA